MCIIIESWTYVSVDGSKQIHVVGYDEGGEDMLDRDTTSLTPSGNLLNGLAFRGFTFTTVHFI